MPRHGSSRGGLRGAGRSRLLLQLRITAALIGQPHALPAVEVGAAGRVALGHPSSAGNVVHAKADRRTARDPAEGIGVVCGRTGMLDWVGRDWECEQRLPWPMENFSGGEAVGKRDGLSDILDKVAARAMGGPICLGVKAWSAFPRLARFPWPRLGPRRNGQRSIRQGRQTHRPIRQDQATQNRIGSSRCRSRPSQSSRPD